MVEFLQDKERKARKEHICNYCYGVINKGEIYRDTILIDGGEIYVWKEHLHCQDVASDLWVWIDPNDYGMTEEDYQEGCREYIRCFIPDISDEQLESLEPWETAKIVHEHLKTHKLQRVRKNGDWYGYWESVSLNKIAGGGTLK